MVLEGAEKAVEGWAVADSGELAGWGAAERAAGAGVAVGWVVLGQPCPGKSEPPPKQSCMPLLLLTRHSREPTQHLRRSGRCRHLRQPRRCTMSQATRQFHFCSPSRRRHLPTNN